jgi:signal transduction histidine kinase
MDRDTAAIRGNDGRRGACAPPLRDLLSDIQHEIRAPLASILASVTPVMGGAYGELSERARDALRLAVDNAGRLDKLVADAFDLTRLEAGLGAYSPRALDLVQLTAEMLSGWQALADERAVSLELQSRSRNGRVRSDPHLLARAMHSLVSNAMKVSTAGHCVRVRIDGAGAVLRWSIADEGPGIPAWFAGRVFQRFQRAERDGQQAEGSGLGLSIARAAIERAGGRIGYVNRPEGGATFYFDIPRAQHLLRGGAR